MKDTFKVELVYWDTDDDGKTIDKPRPTTEDIANALHKGLVDFGFATGDIDVRHAHVVPVA